MAACAGPAGAPVVGMRIYMHAEFEPGSARGRDKANVLAGGAPAACMHARDIRVYVHPLHFVHDLISDQAHAFMSYIRMSTTLFATMSLRHRYPWVHCIFQSIFQSDCYYCQLLTC